MRTILLCAGASSRLGQPKALAMLRGMRVVDRLIDSARPLDQLGRPLVVTGCHDREIRAALRHRDDTEIVTCDRWRDGRTASLQAGLRAVGTGHDVMVAPADVPLVLSQTYLALGDAWRQAGAPAEGWMNPQVTVEGGAARLGHPVIIGRELARRIVGEFGAETPLRDAMELARPRLTVTVLDRGILDDLDTPEDLRSLQGE